MTSHAALTGYLPDRDPSLFARALSDAGVFDSAGWALSDTEIVAPDGAPATVVETIAALFAPHARTEADIDAEFIFRLRERYSLDDELYLARIGTGSALGTYAFQAGEEEELEEYQTFVEGLREWARSEKSALQPV